MCGLLGRDGREMEGTNLLLSERASVVGTGAFMDVIMAEKSCLCILGSL